MKYRVYCRIGSKALGRDGACNSPEAVVWCYAPEPSSRLPNTRIVLGDRAVQLWYLRETVGDGLHCLVSPLRFSDWDDFTQWVTRMRQIADGLVKAPESVYVEEHVLA